MLKAGLGGQSELWKHLEPFGDRAGAWLPASLQGQSAANSPSACYLWSCTAEINVFIHQALPVVFINSVLTTEEVPDFSMHYHTNLDKQPSEKKVSEKARQISFIAEIGTLRNLF